MPRVAKLHNAENFKDYLDVLNKGENLGASPREPHQKKLKREAIALARQLTIFQSYHTTASSLAIASSH
jgi:hypothetical protein